LSLERSAVVSEGYCFNKLIKSLNRRSEEAYTSLFDNLSVESFAYCETAAKMLSFA